MHIVIEIDKEDFEEICMQARMVEDTGTLFGRIRKAIFHSTPLPKGHGDLVTKEQMIDFVNLIDEIRDEKPIIEADRSIE